MLSTPKLRQRPRHFARFTGLSVEEFDRLCLQVQAAYAAQEQQRKTQGVRQRAVGGGRRFNLKLEDRLLATLLYFRLYVSGALLSYLFNLDESNLCRERNDRMLPALLAVLPLPMQDHLLTAGEPESGGDAASHAGEEARRRKRISTLKELLEAHPEFEEVWADATEQEVPKPQTKTPHGTARKKQFYSGKSHCHTIKTQVVTSGRLIVHLFGGCPGSLHDRQLLRASGVMRSIPALPRSASKSGSAPRPDSVLGADTPYTPRKVRLDRGYSGAEDEWAQVPEIEVVIGVKGTRKRPLTAVDRAWNAVLAKKRMLVEQCIGHLKNYRLLSGVYRGHIQRHAVLTRVIAGLHNYRLLPGGTW